MQPKQLPRVAILASGNGTTAEAFIRASATGTVDAQIVCIICNNPTAGIITRTADLNQEYGLEIAVHVISSATHSASRDENVAKGSQTAAEEQAILQLLKESNLDLIVLMGYMKRIGPKIVHEFGWRTEYASPYQAVMLNTHPGLLPESIGLYGVHVQEHVLEKGLSKSGQTLHVVSERYDEGPVIAENSVDVEPWDTPESLFTRVQATEKERLPLDIDAFLKAQRDYYSHGVQPVIVNDK